MGYFPQRFARLALSRKTYEALNQRGLAMEGSRSKSSRKGVAMRASVRRASWVRVPRRLESSGIRIRRIVSCCPVSYWMLLNVRVPTVETSARTGARAE
jgi:hypothetical protein